LSREEFIDIFNAHYDAVRTFVFYRCGDRELASDVAQDVFLRLWEKQYALSEKTVKPMLYKIALSCFISYQRKQQSQAEFEQSIAVEADYEQSPEDDFLFRETAAIYAQTLEEMTEKQRTIFLMNRDEGMTYPEIAALFNISVKAVEKHISTALRLLRSKLK